MLLCLFHEENIFCGVLHDKFKLLIFFLKPRFFFYWRKKVRFFYLILDEFIYAWLFVVWISITRKGKNRFFITYFRKLFQTSNSFIFNKYIFCKIKSKGTDEKFKSFKKGDKIISTTTFYLIILSHITKNRESCNKEPWKNSNFRFQGYTELLNLIIFIK